MKLNWYHKVMYVFCFLVMCVVGRSCCHDDGVITTSKPITGYHIRYYSFTPEHLNNTSGALDFIVTYEFEVAKNVVVTVITQKDDNTWCTVYSHTYPNSLTQGSTSGRIIPQQDFNNSNSGCTNPPTDYNNRNYVVKAAPDMFGPTSADASLTIGTVNFNVRCYYADAMNCLPNGWEQIQTGWASSCPGNAIVPTAINEGGQPNCVTIDNPNHIYDYILREMVDFGYNADHYNTSLLLGLCEVQNASGLLGQTWGRVSSNRPSVSAVLVYNIYGLYPICSNKMITKVSAHELGHARAIGDDPGGFQHSSNNGSNWDKCVMETGVECGSQILNASIYCYYHENIIRTVSWYPNP